MDGAHEPGWRPDPTGRHHQRYWDGDGWSDQVADASGTMSTDPFDPSPVQPTLDQPAAEPPVASTFGAPPGTSPAPGAVPAKAAGGKGPLIAIVAAVLVLAVIAAVALSGGDNGDDDLVGAGASSTTVPDTTTTTERATTTTTPEFDPDDVVGEIVEDVVVDITRAGFTVEQVPVLDESVPSGTILSAVEEPRGTIVLTIARPPLVIYLEALSPVDNEGASAGPPPFSVAGTTYQHGALIDTRRCQNVEFVEYDLGRDFLRFVASVGVTDTTPADVRARVDITLDGVSVASADLGVGQALPIDLDVVDALRLRFTVSRTAGTDCYDVGVGDGSFIGVSNRPG